MSRRKKGVLTSIFNNRGAFRDFVRDEVPDAVEYSIVEQYRDGSGMLMLNDDWRAGFEGRFVLVSFSLKLALRILRKGAAFRRNAGQQRKPR